jgi:hypothetical protein
MPKKIFFFLLLQTLWATGFSQSLSLARLGETFQRTNLVVRWDAPTNTLPPAVWIYRVLPKTFPPEAVSNLVAQCGFARKDKKFSNADQTVYKNADKFPSKQLGISHGGIVYITVSHYGPTNLARDVPTMIQMPELTTNFLSKLGINVSDIEKNAEGAPNFHFWEPFKEYFMPDKIVTNIEFRAVGFSRAVDGATVIGAGIVGDGEIYFGEHGNPTHIDLSWRDLERTKSYVTATPEIVIKWIRNGKAVQGGIPMDLPPIDWPTVKSLTVKKADLCYYAGDSMVPSAWLMPLLSLWTTVDTGHGNVDVEIDCPIIDETKP